MNLVYGGQKAGGQGGEQNGMLGKSQVALDVCKSE
jgi:hypothetical protein